LVAGEITVLSFSVRGQAKIREAKEHTVTDKKQSTKKKSRAHYLQ
jgi:hypothetical protein